jgi:ABC-2 type transport system ATP-binding protein
MSVSSNVIETFHLTKIFGDKYISLNGADLVVPQGTVCGLIGPNGAGKTTTIRLLLGLQNPTAGRVEVFGEPMTPNAVHLRRRIGYLPTNPRFPRDMTPIAYLDFIGKLCGLPREERKPRLAALLRAVGLLSASSQKVKGFSTGMITRLGIAASLINDPELLIWDEPTSGLDPEGRKYTIDLIRELGQNKTLLVSSHNLGDIKQVCNHIAILSEGKLIFNGPIQEMTRFTRSNTVELDISGDLDVVTSRIKTEHPNLRWERERSVLRLMFDEVSDIAPGLVQALQVVADSGAILVAIDSLQDEMVDAFIQLLEEERGHGFSRIFRDAQTSDGLSGVNRKRSEVDD